MMHQRTYFITILICCLASNSFSQSDDFIEKWGDRLFFRTLKHEIWRPYFELDSLKKNDTIYIWSRRANRRSARYDNGIYLKKEHGDIRFKRNGKIFKRTFEKIKRNKEGKITNKFVLEWTEIGKWRKNKGLLIIEIGNFYSVLEWRKQDRESLDFIVLEAHRNGTPQ